LLEFGLGAQEMDDMELTDLFGWYEVLVEYSKEMKPHG
jgi:hypothetical protein